jgi:hypothetical protein
MAYLRDLIVLVFPKHNVLRLNLLLSFIIKTLPETPDETLWDGTQVSVVRGWLLAAWAMLIQILLELQSPIMFVSNI